MREWDATKRESERGKNLIDWFCRLQPANEKSYLHQLKFIITYGPYAKYFKLCRLYKKCPYIKTLIQKDFNVIGVEINRLSARGRAMGEGRGGQLPPTPKIFHL